MPFAPGEFTGSRVWEFVKGESMEVVSGERVGNSVSGKNVWRDVRRVAVSIGLSVESELVCGERTAGVNWLSVESELVCGERVASVNWLVVFGKLSVVSRLSSP